MIRQAALFTIALSLIAGGCTCSSEPPASLPTADQESAAQETSGTPVVAARPASDSAPGTAPSRDRRPDGEQPPLKSRWSRSLSDQLDRIDGGTSQERDVIRETLRKNDVELDRAFTNMPGRIEAANNTHDGPRRIAIPAP
jgi:hypothetical protein